MVSSYGGHIVLAQKIQEARGSTEAVKCTVKDGTSAVADSISHGPRITLELITLDTEPTSGWSVSGASCLSFAAREPRSPEV